MFHTSGSENRSCSLLHFKQAQIYMELLTAQQIITYMDLFFPQPDLILPFSNHVCEAFFSHSLHRDGVFISLMCNERIVKAKLLR